MKPETQPPDEQVRAVLLSTAGSLESKGVKKAALTQRQPMKTQEDGDPDVLEFRSFTPCFPTTDVVSTKFMI